MSLDKILGQLKIFQTPEGRMQWSARLSDYAKEKSPNWDARKKGRFRKDDVYPCNEGIPKRTHIGPVSNNMPLLFDLILADSRKRRGWMVNESHGGMAWNWLDLDSRKIIPYHEVAGWSRP